MNGELITVVRDIGFYFATVWLGVVGIGAALAGLAPLWRRCSASLDDGTPQRSIPPAGG